MDNKTEESATAATDGKARGHRVAVTGDSISSGTKKFGGKKRLPCLECGKIGHFKSEYPERICEVCGGESHIRDFINDRHVYIRQCEGLS